MAHYVCCSGGREFRDVESVREVLGFLKLFYGADLGVIHGAARGLDSLVQQVCEELGIKVRGYPADWNTHGRAAGHVRNAEMAKRLAYWRDVHGHTVQLVSWPGGNGTMGMRSDAASYNIPISVIEDVPATIVDVAPL